MADGILVKQIINTLRPAPSPRFDFAQQVDPRPLSTLRRDLSLQLPLFRSFVYIYHAIPLSTWKGHKF